MAKSKPLLFLLFCTFICWLYIGTVNAKPSDTPQSFEELFPEIGYKSVADAVNDFEDHMNQELKLPTRVPPISFTHYVGRFSNLDGEINDSLEVKFISDQIPEHHFKIDVRPIQHKITIGKDKSKVYKLKNGTTATYIDDLKFGFNMLVFELDNWQYMFSVDADISDKVTAEILIQIANSIDS
ncbi:hypothetical protein [Sporosarcina luteola]|uniref:hypothetical protein n=1 Tax=Sporosarcina luteola TaxID=582850 RepID=UPI002041C542|nr:hypothetical protein [Sporosarcina luteola]MCM3711105.1 hypothetical protein [Sporosarcina luteola]